MKKVLRIRSSEAAKLFAGEQALIPGLHRVGYSTEILNSQYPVNADSIAGKYEFAVCSGAHKSTLRGREACIKAGIPVLFVELGYLKRSYGSSDSSGYFQLGWNKLCSIPESVPGDRWDKLGIQVVEHAPPGAYVLTATQVGNDAQHNLSSKALEIWLTSKAAEIAGSRQLPAVWRQHPSQTYLRPERWPESRVQSPKKVPLGQALREADCVVTYNSTLGVDAMLYGLEVYSHPSAHYAGHAVRDLETRLRYLRRLAYAQWNFQELESGEGVEFVLTLKPGAF